MKLKRFEKENQKQRKIIMVILATVSILGVGLLLSKTFSLYQANKSFEFVNGKVNYYGHADIYFEYYQDTKKLDKMPQKGNSENLVFEKAVCDNNANVEWDSNKWGPLVTNLNKTKTKCMLYFKEISTGAEFIKDLAKNDPTNIVDDNTSDHNMRYIGASPKNYIYLDEGTYDTDITKYLAQVYTEIMMFDTLAECQEQVNQSVGNPDALVEDCHEVTYAKAGEKILWRVIGVLGNVKTSANGAGESRIKVVRDVSIGQYAWDSNDQYNWAKPSTLNTLLQGRSEASNKYIDNAVWYMGMTGSGTASDYYKSERNTSSTWAGKIALMYPSDYGLAVGGSVRSACLTYDMFEFSTKWDEEETIDTKCEDNDWIYEPGADEWLFTAGYITEMEDNGVYWIAGYSGSTSPWASPSMEMYVRPTAYLKSSVKITGGSGTKEDPYTVSL